MALTRCLAMLKVTVLCLVLGDATLDSDNDSAEVRISVTNLLLSKGNLHYGVTDSVEKRLRVAFRVTTKPQRLKAQKGVKPIGEASKPPDVEKQIAT